MVAAPVGSSLALAILHGVRVVRLGGKATVLDDELEGVIHLTSIAALVLTMNVTIHQFLLQK